VSGAFCTQCGDEFDPVEYVTVPQDPGEPRFCSGECEDDFHRAEEERTAYDEAGAGAPVY
jgi:hypothetical protein